MIYALLDILNKYIVKTRRKTADNVFTNYYCTLNCLILNLQSCKFVRQRHT